MSVLVTASPLFFFLHTQTFHVDAPFFFFLQFLPSSSSLLDVTYYSFDVTFPFPFFFSFSLDSPPFESTSFSFFSICCLFCLR